MLVHVDSSPVWVMQYEEVFCISTGLRCEIASCSRTGGSGKPRLLAFEVLTLHTTWLVNSMDLQAD